MATPSYLLKLYFSWFKCIVLVVFFIAVPSGVEAQNDDHPAVQAEKIKPENDKFFMSSIGANLTTFRDFATSPLFYTGPGISLGLGQLWLADDRETTWMTDLNLAATRSQPPESSYFPTNSRAWFANGRIYTHHLRRIEKFSIGQTQFMAGGAFVADFNGRLNEGLGNAAGGIEALVNLMAVAKLHRDVSRKEAKTLNFWLFKPTYKPAKRSLDFRLNVGMVNLNYRPGYAFLNDTELDGVSEPGLDWLLSDYAWKLNGWRLGTCLDYTVFKNAYHALRLSYQWDAVHAPGRFEAFQMAAHTLRFTLLFNTKREAT